MPIERSSLGLSPRAVAVLCYAAAWVSGLVILAFERQSRLVRFHAWQSVLGLGGLFGLGFVLWTTGMFMAFVSTGLFRTVTWVSLGVWAVMAVAWLAGVIAAARGTRWRMPVVGGYAERWAAGSPGRH
jgi:uncharacterized membrane protein